MKKAVNLLLILVVLSLSGCSSINEVDEDKVKDISDKITEAIIHTTEKTRAERQESHTVDAENLSSINIKSSVGQIYIDTHKSQDALIELSIIAESGSAERSEQLINDFVYTVEKGNKSIDIDTTYKDKTHENENISTDLTVTVPENITNIIISLNVGDIHIKNINGKFEINDNVGNIIVANSQGNYNLSTNVGDIKLGINAADKKSKFVTNTGNINLDIKDIKDADSIKAVTNVGNVNITVPDNSDYEAVIKEFMQKNRTESNGNKNTKIEITTDIGKISFN